MADRALYAPEVQDRVRLGRTSIWRLERAGEFPRRRQLSAGRVAWLESEIEAWLASRPVAGDDGTQAA